jgi:hypothetical protein
MVVGANTILKHLPSYKNNRVELSDDQSVSDIMKAIKNCHKQSAKDYDKIAHFFIGKNELQTCKNIFNFLRANTRYFIESEDEQTVKSPAAILKTKNIDCKNYALFAGGVLDAINRSEKQYIPYCYRFVSNSIFDSNPNHVFICAFLDDDEIWIDPIPQVLEFNYKLPFYNTIDKNYTAMSLYSISGAGSQMGFAIPIGMNEIKQISSIITNLFGNKPNPNDWQGWEKQDRERGSAVGVSAQHWTVTDGDSVPNEAINIIRWIENYGLQTVVGYDSWHKRDITLQDLANKLRRGGYPNEAQQFLQASDSVINKIAPVNVPPRSGEPFTNSGGFNNTGTGLNMLNNTGTQRAGLSPILLIGLAGAAAYFIFGKK